MIHRYHELYQFNGDPDIGTAIQVARLRWARDVWRMDNNEIPKRVTEYKLGGRRSVGRPKIQWMVEVET